MEKYNNNWDPLEWQDYCFQLIRAHHGPRVQRIPDKDRGDMGIEAFTFDEHAVIYQCYCPDYPASIAERSAKITAKLQSDVPKLILNEAKILDHVGARKFRQWTLMVPLFDSKDPLKKCVKETRRITAANLQFIDSVVFDVNIADQNDFASEIEELKRRASIPYRSRAQEATDQDVISWRQAHNLLVERLDGKLERGYPTDTDIQRDVKTHQFVKWFIDKANITELLRRDYPDLWESVKAATADAERILATFGANGGTAQEILGNQLSSLKIEIKKIMPGYQEAEINKIAIGCLADWLMECPLDFPARPQ